LFFFAPQARAAGTRDVSDGPISFVRKKWGKERA